MIATVDRLFLRVRATPFLLRMAWFTRILLAAGFIPTGMVKLLGHRFTLIGPESPIGAFFEALYQTGGYWRFLGASQVLAGVLLLAPRATHVGALLFLPIMVNIFVVTVALGFRGTPVVTALMLLAVVFLVAWDYHRVRSVVTTRPWPDGTVVPELRLDRWEHAGFVLFAASLLSVFGMTRGWAASVGPLPAIVVGTVAGLWTLGRFLTVGRKLT